MGLVEGILGEFLPVLPYFVKNLFRMTVFHTSGHELVFQGVEDIDELLSHRLSQLVRLSLGEACQFLRQEHDLLLIDRHAVSVLKIFLHFRKVIFHFLDTLLAGNEGRDVVHRARSVESVHRNQVLESFRLKLLQPVHHTRRLELEHADRISTSIELVRGFIVDRNGLYVYVYSVPFLYEVEAGMYDCQGVKAQEVHLEHADILDVMSVILRCPEFLFLSVLIDRLLVFRKADWNIVHQISASDDGCTCMDAYLTDASLKFLGIEQYLLIDFSTVFQFLLKLRDKPVAILQVDLCIDLLHSDLIEFLNRLLLSGIVGVIYLNHPAHLFESLFELIQLRIERVFLLFHFAQAVRHHLGQAVGFFNAQVADSGHILDCAFCRHSTEGYHP